MSRRQRAVGHEGDAHLLTNGNQFPLVLPVEQVVVVLHGLKLRPAVVTGGKLHIVKLVTVHGRGTQRPHLAGLHQIVQSLHGFFDWRVIVKAMDDIQIEIIRSQPLQSPVDLPVNCPGGQPAGIEIDLGGNDHLVPGDVLFQCPPQIFFAGSGRVAIGGVKKVDAQRKCVFDHFLCFCFIQRPVVHGPCLAEAHAADTQLGDLNIRIS